MRELLDGSACPDLLSRPAVQELFGGISARQANRIMRSCAGLLVGRSYLVKKGDLREYLAKYEESGAVEREGKRKQRIEEILRTARRQARAREIRIPVTTHRGKREFPPGVELSAEELRIVYTGGTDLLTKLYLIVQYIAEAPEEVGL